MSTPLARVAILWSRFGPYHLARLRGAAEAGAGRGSEIHGIAVAEKDAVYGWAPCESGDEFVRHTIFPGEDYSQLSPRSIVSATVHRLEAIQPDVVAVNGWSVPEAYAAIEWGADRRAIKTIVMSETKEDDGRRSWWKENIKRRRLSVCHAGLVGGRAHKDYLVKLGLPADRVFLGYDVVDNAHFERGAAEARAETDRHRRELSLPEQYFFACTRFLRRKNLDGLLEAYALYRARASMDPWSLVIAGSGEEQGRLCELEGRLGLQGVQWVGFLQYRELPLYYGLAGAFVHPAKSEPWGLVVNEAAASGLPLLVSNTVGAGHELVLDGENGFRFDPNDVGKMCEAMLRLSDMPTERRRDLGLRSLEISRLWTPIRFGNGLFDAAEAAMAAPQA